MAQMAQMAQISDFDWDLEHPESFHRNGHGHLLLGTWCGE
jgi:hypothetical protein